VIWLNLGHDRAIGALYRSQNDKFLVWLVEQQPTEKKTLRAALQQFSSDLSRVSVLSRP